LFALKGEAGCSKYLILRALSAPIKKLLNDFAGQLTTSKWAKIANCTQYPAPGNHASYNTLN